MSIEGQGHFFTIYFPGFVCFVLYLAKISGERLQDHWSSGLHRDTSLVYFSYNPRQKYVLLCDLHPNLKACFTGVNDLIDV